MGLNTYPYSPFPASTEQLHKGDNEQIQAEIDQLKSDLTDLSEEVTGEATVYPYADVITIEDAVPSNLADCSVKIEPVQSGSGDPSPTNIRPITGHTEASVVVADDAENPTVTKTYTIALGDTIYGGTVDFDSGVMTVDRAYAEYDGSNDENWQLTEGENYYQFYLTNPNALNYYNFITNEFVVKSANYRGVENIAVLYNDKILRIALLPSFGITTLSDFSDFLNDNNLQVCYFIATPTTIQLTPQQIQLLKGTNTLTASTGQISVTVNGVSGSIGSMQEQANATDAELAELAADIAEQLPTAPTTDGAYVLTVTVESGTPTYSWESAE